MIISLLLVAACLFVAFTNGANANSKGVASLYGSGACSLRTALLWGTSATFLGSVSSIFLAGAMIKTFGGRGLVDDSLANSVPFATSVAIGAAITSFLGTRFGFPVSTTHGIVGALVGSGWVGSTEPLNLLALGNNFVYPLLLSPIIAGVIAAVATIFFAKLGRIEENLCYWIQPLHFIAGGAASFARGLNDTPKIAALFMLIPGIATPVALCLVGLFIALGGILDSKNVAETLGKKLTSMSPQQGLAANLVTAFLVTTASLQAFPVSTTHVSVGSIVGMGISTRQARLRKVCEVLSAWLTTLPISAIIASVTFLVLRYFFA